MKTRADAEGPAVIDWWKGEGSLIDYFNPEAVEWWHGLVDKTLAYGIDGWKCDGLDFSAIQAKYSPGAGRDVERIEYSHAYYQDFHDYTRDVLGEDRVNTTRPVDNYGADIGGEAVQFSPQDITWAGWVGDQDGTFEASRPLSETCTGLTTTGTRSLGLTSADIATRTSPTDVQERAHSVGAAGSAQRHHGERRVRRPSPVVLR